MRRRNPADLRLLRCSLVGSLVALLIGCGVGVQHDAYRVIIHVLDENGQPIQGQAMAVSVPSPCERTTSTPDASFETYCQVGQVLLTDASGKAELDVPSWSGICLPSSDDFSVGGLKPPNAPYQCWLEVAFSSAPRVSWLIVADQSIKKVLQPYTESRVWGKPGEDTRPFKATFTLDSNVDFSATPTLLTLRFHHAGVPNESLQRTATAAATPPPTQAAVSVR